MKMRYITHCSIFLHSIKLYDCMNDIHKESFKLDDYEIWDSFLTYYSFKLVILIIIHLRCLSRRWLMSLYMQLRWVEERYWDLKYIDLNKNFEDKISAEDNDDIQMDN